VHLDPGNYALSWWDQARDSIGRTVNVQPTYSYAALVLDTGNNEIASLRGAPYAAPLEAGVTSLWSDRHVLTFSVTKAGTYTIAFSASLASDIQLGSVAIADVQLEAVTGGTAASTYTATGDSRMVPALGCPRSASDFRAAFVHQCDADGTCYYDLNAPLVINTVAKGNFNFRHITLALNLVGTGVRDCSSTPTPECYGTGYLEYTQEHDAQTAGILDYAGNLRTFDFGIADVRRGKALAAERFLTMPLSSADQSLVSQPGIQHMELRGRPLDGAYRLRIWDSPALKWEHLEDIQVVLNYRYWSEIIANGNGQH
jgi:hypothetical protein